MYNENNLQTKIDNILKRMLNEIQINKKLCNELDKTNLPIIPNIFDNIIKNIESSFDSHFPLIPTNNLLISNKPFFLEKKPFFVSPPPPPPPFKEVFIKKKIKNIRDLINLCKDFPLDSTVKYNINMQTIHAIKQPLIELDSMIGMAKLKDAVFDQLLFYIQKLHCNKKNTGDYMHTIIFGPPGTGKTEVAEIMGKIFNKLEILKKGSFTKVTRADLIAGYLGQTAIKTKKVIEKALGGVLFIDEAYALGNSEKRDSFSKECIDTLCECLSNYKNELMVIIAGYEEELQKCFFSYNSGLESRFTWRFHINKYNGDELFQIFEKKIKDIDWTIQKKIKSSWFEDKKDCFPFFGRDIETFVSKIKIAHSRRVFGKKSTKKKITMSDLNRGFEIFQANSKKNESDNSKIYDLYI